jgi:hypothetical protein
MAYKIEELLCPDHSGDDTGHAYGPKCPLCRTESTITELRLALADARRRAFERAAEVIRRSALALPDDSVGPRIVDFAERTAEEIERGE